MNRKLITVALFSVSLFFAMSASALFDPTQPDTYVKPEVKPVKAKNKSKKQQAYFRLESILIASDRKIASINGKLYQVGDKVSGLKVMEINADHVVLKSEQGRRVLQLLTKQVKR